MAPERTRGDVAVDIRADIYSLGATVYTLLTGRPPFEGKTLSETVTKIRQDDPVPPKKYQDAIPDEFQDVVEKMLAKRPEVRHQTPGHVTRALERVAKAQAGATDPTNRRSSGCPAIPGRPAGNPARVGMRDTGAACEGSLPGTGLMHRARPASRRVHRDIGTPCNASILNPGADGRRAGSDSHWPANWSC